MFPKHFFSWGHRYSSIFSLVARSFYESPCKKPHTHQRLQPQGRGCGDICVDIKQKIFDIWTATRWQIARVERIIAGSNHGIHDFDAWSIDREGKVGRRNEKFSTQFWRHFTSLGRAYLECNSENNALRIEWIVRYESLTIEPSNFQTDRNSSDPWEIVPRQTIFRISSSWWQEFEIIRHQIVPRVHGRTWTTYLCMTHMLHRKFTDFRHTGREKIQHE